jgi:enoyl-CoA hydratase/carnithine racemase
MTSDISTPAMNDVPPPIDPDGEVHVRQDGRILIMTINRPAKYNGFTPRMLEDLGAAYTRLEQDDGLWVGLLAAAGPHFTAGMDMPKIVPHFARNARMFNPEHVDALNNSAPLRTKPVVAVVQGITFTMGIELMLAADMVVAADDCRFSQLEVRRGAMATGGATIRMVQSAGWGNAMRYLLTGDEFDAATALRLGFVQQVVPAGRQFATGLDLARHIAAQAPLAVRETRSNAWLALAEGADKAVAGFQGTVHRLNATRDLEEGVRSFMEKRTANFTGE